MQIELGFGSMDMGKNVTVFLLLAISLFVGASSFFISLQGLDSVYGISKGIILKDPASYYDSSGKLNIVGVIDTMESFLSVQLLESMWAGQRITNLLRLLT